MAGWNCLPFMASIILVLCSFNEQTMLAPNLGHFQWLSIQDMLPQTLHTVDGTSLLPPRVGWRKKYLNSTKKNRGNTSTALKKPGPETKRGESSSSKRKATSRTLKSSTSGSYPQQETTISSLITPLPPSSPFPKI